MYYLVTVGSKNPIAGERDGTIRVDAKNGKEAISLARREMSDRGYGRFDGPFTYTPKRDDYQGTA